MNIGKFLSEVNSRKWDKKYAYKMGRDCQKNGENTTNCHFMIFRSPENTKAWERGKRDVKEETKNASK